MNSTTIPSRSIRGLLALALGLSQPAARAELLTNGSFETVTPSPGTGAYEADGSTVLDGWTLGAGSEGLKDIYIANSWAGRSPTDGSVFVCLKYGASLSQTFISTGGGATLTLNYYNMTQVGVSPHWADLIWSLNGVDIGNTASGSVSTWASASTVVTLLAGSNTLRIRQSPSSKGDVMCLDNVKLEATASPPPAPTGLGATAGNAQVALTWTASSGATGYNVKRSETSGSGYATIGTASVTNYTDSTAANGSTYYYVVSATNIVGESADSSPQVSATPSLSPAPLAPAGLGATAGNATVALTWTASSGATGYTVKRSETSGSGYATLGTPSGTSYIDSTAANGNTYYYVVSASNAGGEGVNSSEVSATPVATASLLANGSFEIVSPSPATGTSYAAGASTALAGWTLGAGSEGLQDIYIANYWAGNIHPTDGSIYTCLKYGASLSQTFNAPTSGSFTLTFNYYEADNMFGGTNDAATALQWYMDGSLIGNSIGSTVNGWVSQSHTLTLTAGSHIFVLKHNNSSSGDVITLDNVKLVAPVPAIATHSTMMANPTAVSCDGVSTSTLTVTLKDANGNPVAGKTVTLAKASGPGTPVITTLSGTTNGSGVATFTVASTTAGTDVFTATDVTDSVTFAQTAAVTFTVDSFASWAGSKQLAGADARMSADPDQDGIANVLEYVLGGEPNPANPGSNSRDLLPTVAPNANGMLFSFRQTALSLIQPAVDLSIEYSSDLINWSPAQDGIDGVAITVNKNGFASGVDKVEVSFPQSLTADGKFFARLKVATSDSTLPDQIANQLAACDVVWDSPSTNSAGSMPLGNGDIGLNAWVEESGDLVFFISKTDAWTDCGRMVKLGQVRVRLTPSLATLPFRQQLQLLHGQMVITSGPEGSATTLRLWVDANRPVIHIEAESQQEMQAQVGLYVWRTADRDWQGDGTVGYISSMNTGPLIEKADTVLPPTDNCIVWYHRNELTIYPWTMAAQGLTSLVPLVSDPLLHRTFGGCISGAGLVQAEAGAATQALTTVAPTRHLDVAIDVLTAQTDTAGQWLDQLNDIVVEEQGTEVAAAWAAHCQWWEDFWNRSWIFVHTPEDDTPATAAQIAARVTARDALQLTGNGGLSNHIRPAVSTDPDGPVVTSGYARQRFVTAAAGRGAYPIKHDGSIFTVNTRDPASLVEADYRVHGANYWFLDSATTSYGPMLRSGDYEQLLPLFGMYRAMVPMARERTKQYFGHEGIFIPATVYPWGTFQTNEYVQYLWQGGLELTAKMLDYYEATQNVAFLRETLLPLADGVATFYDRHWQRDTNGKIRLDPACALESVHHAVNPLPEIAGLWYVLPRLLALPAGETTAAQRAAWAETLADLPNVPMSGTAGAEICVAAEVIYDRQGDEMPELYGVFPYRLYALGCPDFDIGRRSVEAYSPAPPQTGYPLAGRVGGWRLNPIQVAFVGKAQQAAGMVVSNFASHDPGSRFPAFWGPNQVGSKDQSHGGVSMTALQAMLLQVEGRKIYLFPAWPKTWDVNFKLHALYNTTVEGELRDGQVISLKVTPESRTADVVNLLNQ